MSGTNTEAYMELFNSRNDKPRSMRPKSNYSTSNAGGRDLLATPEYAVPPLLPYLNKKLVIWESAAGEGYLAKWLKPHVKKVIATEITDNPKFDFFTYEPKAFYDIQITNPPYSLKYKWLARSYALGRPFALLLPVETLGAKSAQILFEDYGIGVIFVDKRINFKTPKDGWNSSAQFPTAWFCWRMGFNGKLVFAHIGGTDGRRTRTRKA